MVGMSKFKNNHYISLSYKDWHKITPDEKKYLSLIHKVDGETAYKMFLHKHHRKKYSQKYKTQVTKNNFF